MDHPITNGSNGRDRAGKFLPGNPGGPGNLQAAQVAKFRAVMLGAVGEDDMRKVVEVLITNAKAGEPWAIKELLDRVLGKPSQAVEMLGDVAGVIVKVVKGDAWEGA